MGSLLALLPLGLAGGLVLGGLWVALRRVDPGRAEAAAAWGRGLAPRGRGLLAAGAVAFGVGALLVLAAGAFRGREAARRGAATASARERGRAGGSRGANRSPVTQFAPAVAVVEERTYARTLTLPPDFLARLGTEGAGTLAPYLGDPGADGVTALRDSFVRSGANVVFTREVVRRDERPVTMGRARIEAGFAFRDAIYRNTFSGEYEWANLADKPVEMRFSFPAPQGSGPVAGFRLDVSRPGAPGPGASVTEPDPRTGTYQWSGPVPPGGRVRAAVRYEAEGAREYRYVLGSDRRKIADLEFRLRADRAPRVLRDGLTPTAGSATSATWALKDVLTSSSVAVAFSGADAGAEGLDRTLAWLPAVLGLFAFGAWLARPERAWRGALGFGAGLLGIVVLAGYLPPGAAVLAGAGLAFVAGAAALGSLRGALVALGGGLLACVFLTSVHGTLAAWVLLLVALGPVLAPRRRQAPRGSPSE